MKKQVPPKLRMFANVPTTPNENSLVMINKTAKSLQNKFTKNVNAFGQIRTASVVQWSEFLATDLEVRFLSPALPDFLSSSGSGTGSTQPREYK
jgi:hypothetical protein